MSPDVLILRRLIGHPRRLALLAGAVTVVMLLTYGVSGFLPRTYEATSLVAVGPAISGSGPAPGINEMLGYQQLAQAYAQLGKSRAVAASVIERLGLTDSPESLLNSYATTAANDSVYIEVRARHSDAQRAADLAMAVAEGLISSSPLIAGEGSAERLLVVVDGAVPPDSQISPRPLLNTLIAGVVSLFAGAVLLIWLELRDRPIRSAQDADALGLLPVIGSIGERSRAAGPLLMLEMPESPHADAVPKLSGRVQLAMLHGARSVLVTSHRRHHESRTVVAASLAIALAQAGRSTILVDASRGESRLDRLFGLPNDRGLSTLLQDDTWSFDNSAAKIVENLWVLPAGPLSAVDGRFGSPRLRRVIDDLKLRADIAIIDGPPLEGGADGQLVAAVADATLLVITAGVTTVNDVRQAAALLDAAGANPLGSALVHAATPGTSGSRVGDTELATESAGSRQ